MLWCGTRRVRSALAAFLDQYSAESSATKISAKRASTRGLPDSRTTASANSSRDAIIRSRSLRNFAHRSWIGSFAHSHWVTRARETISGSRHAGVLSKCASTSPVAGLIEGSESIGMAVAAISGILTDLGPERGRAILAPAEALLFGKRLDSSLSSDLTSE